MCEFNGSRVRFPPRLGGRKLLNDAALMTLRMTVAAVLKLVELCLKFCQRPDSGIHRLNLTMQELVNMPGLFRLTAVVIQNLADFLKTHI